MDNIFAFVGKDYACIVGDSVAKQSILAVKQHHDRIKEIFPTQCLSLVGEPGDVVHFGDYLEANLRLAAFRQNGEPLSMTATSSLLRKEIATAIRKDPKNVFMILAGIDKVKPPRDAISKSKDESDKITSKIYQENKLKQSAENKNGEDVESMHDTEPVITEEGSEVDNDENVTIVPSVYAIDYLGTIIKNNFVSQGHSNYFLPATFDKWWKENMTIEEGREMIKQCINVLGRAYLLQQTKFMIKWITADGIIKEEINYIPEEFGEVVPRDQ